ncbi:hypothetical protein NNF94_06855, partial [Enterococcus faecium]|nr:hypothetical protein [Enterococcus faecium]MDT6618343.1 hypothetical protein [Enterococcus faecium]MDV4590124.1 hypothetical protein [Enterococcus faecium]MDV4707776.1 hypothetical protein [Enterococcus faecium]MDV4738657.1 hypothetical protein [Enterococcus faecium]
SSSFLLLSFSIILPYLIVDLKLCNRTGIGMVTKKELRDDLPQLNSLDLLAARLYWSLAAIL